MLTWCRSSIGKKTLMALSGVVLLGFVVAHLTGNLLIYAGPAALNAYAKKLRDLGPLLWIARLSLLITVLIHSWTSIALARDNQRARPIGYRLHRTTQTTFAARAMLFSGLLLLVYIVYHLLHFTFGLTNPDLSNLTDSLGHHDVYRMVVGSFQSWPIVVAYVLGMAALCWHLSHGIGSLFQTLGLNHDRTLALCRSVGRFVALVLFLGYISIPLAVWTGFIK